MKTSVKNLFHFSAPMLALMLLMAATMASQAVAKPPTPVITEPKNNGKWSNSVYTVIGTFKAPVTNVVCLLNGTPITTTLSNTTWRAQADLTAGTNTVDAYGVSATGDSATNKVKLVYLLVSKLSLTIIGEGTVSPNDTNATLIIGDKYKLKANPKPGFGVYFWNVGGYMTNGDTVDFTMVTNLAIVLHISDITPPTIVIDEPKNGDKETSVTVTASGTAKDNVGVVLVAARINGGDWSTATGTSNWTVNLPPSVGANDIQAYAEDAAGNISKTNEVKFTSTVTSQTTWSPSSINNDVVLLAPTLPVGAMHYLCFSNANFTYSDTNKEPVDSGIGEGDYMQVETNYGVVQIEFTAPPEISGDTANIDLGFTNFNVGYYTNEASGELGTFSIQPTDVLLPKSWSGKTLTLQPVDAKKASTVIVTSDSNFHLVAGSASIPGTYVVNKVNSIGAFFDLQITYLGITGDLLFQPTYTSTTEGIYEINDYTNGVLIKSDVGTFKQ